MSHIFLSYSRDDELLARNLAKDLQGLNHNVWFDQDLSGGQAWWEQILAKIREADIFVFVLSQSSLYSTACQREYGYAAALHKPILPVVVSEGLSLNLLPPPLTQVQFLDYRERDVDAIISLTRSLQSLPVGVALPDPLPAQPEVPISYLGNLSQQIETTSTLSPEEQSRLVLELKTGLRDPATNEDTKILLGRLRARRDLMATIADEIDELLSADQTREPTPSAAFPRPAGVLPRSGRPAAPAVAPRSAPGSGPSPTAPASASPEVSKLRSIAEQKIWLHWLMWFVPFVSWVTCFVSAALIRNPKPIAIGLGVSFVFGFLGGMSNESSLVYLGAILGSAIGAALTHVEIQRARNQLLAKD